MDPSVVRVVNTGISNGADFDKISLAMYNAGAGDAVVEQAREYYNSIKKKSPSVAGVSPSTSAPSASSSAFGPTKVQSRLDVDPSGLYGQVEDYNKRVNTANRLYDVLSKKEELSEQDIQNVRNDYQEYRSFYPDLPVVPSQDNSLLIDKVARDVTRTVIDAQPKKSKYRDFMESIYENKLGGDGFFAGILRGTEEVVGDVVSSVGAINDATDAFYSSVFGEETTKNYNKAFEGTPLEPGAISQFGKGMTEQWNENTKKIAENWGMTEEQYEQGPFNALMEGDLTTAGKGISIGMLHTLPELVAIFTGLRFAKGAAIAGEALTANLISKGTPKWIAGAAGRARTMAPTSIPLYTGANYAEVLDDPEFTTGEKMLYAVGSAVGSTLAESVGGFGEYLIGGAAKKEAVNQIKSSVMQSIGKGTVDMLKAAGIEGAEEVLDGGIQQALGVALGDRKFSTNNILDGFLIGAAMGGSTNVISKSPSLIGLSSDMLKTIKITDELAKINAALTDPSISDSERELLTNRVRVANDEIRRAKQTASVFFQNYTPEDLQETISLNADIRRQVMDLPSFKTEEAKSAAIQSVRDSVSRLKEIEGKYDSKTQQQVQGDIQAGAQPGGVQIEGTGTEEAAPDRVLQDVSQSEEEQVARQRTEQASSINVKPRLKRMKVTTANAPGAYRMMMDALSNYTDEFLSQNGTSRAAVERGIKSLFDVVSSLDAKGREVEIDVIGSIDEANKLFGFEVKEDNGKFVVSSKIPDAGRVFDTMEEANAYTNRVLYRGVNMMTDGDKVNISVLLPAMLDNTGYHEALHSLEVFDDKAADKLVVNLMRSLSKLPRLDARMIAFMDSYRGKPEADRNREFLAELGSMISSGEISVEVRDSVIKNMTDTFMKFIRNMLGIGGDVTPSAGQLARTFNDIADKLGRGEKQASYATTGSTPKFQRATRPDVERGDNELSADEFSALSKRLNKFFKGKVKIVDADTFEKEAEKVTGERIELKSNDGTIYGAVLPNGVMFINKLNADSLLHEHTHLFNQVVMNSNPKLWGAIKSAVKQTKEWGEVKDNPLYSNLKTDDQIADEVFSKIIGNAAENGWQSYKDQSLYQKIKALAQKFYNTILEAFGVDYYKGMSATGLADLTLTELMGGVSTTPYQIDAKINDILSQLLKGTKYFNQVRFNVDPESRRKFEKALGEKDGRALYDIFGNVQDAGKVIEFAKSKFPIKGSLSTIASRAARDDNGNNILNGNFGSIVIYKEYQRYIDTQLEDSINETTLRPEDLLNEVGYTLYNPTNLKEAQDSFLHYYKKGKNICTLNPGSTRFKDYFVTFIVKDDAAITPMASELTQDNLTNDWKDYLEKKGRKNADGTYNLNGLDNNALDPYSLSVVSLQINKSNGSTKEISRYNHQIGSPDNIFNKDFDKLIEGLGDAMYKKFGVDKNTKQSKDTIPLNVIQDANGRFFNYIEEQNGVYYGDGFYLENGVATILDKGSERMVDGFVINAKGEIKDVLSPTMRRRFFYGDIYKVNYFRGNEISLETDRGTFVFEIKNGAVVKLIEFPKEWRIEQLQKWYRGRVKVNKDGKLILPDVNNFTYSDINTLWGDDIIGIYGVANFKWLKIQSLGGLKYIGGDAYFKNSQFLQSLGGLRSIGGDAYFRNSQIQSLGELGYIGGGAYFINSQIQSLGNLKYIGGYADFANSQVQSLGKLEYIGENANFANSQVQSLGKLEYIGEDAYFRNSQIQSLGELRYIGWNANFANSQVQSLGKLEYIRGSADFENSQIQSLGELRYIRGSADFANSQIQSLGDIKYIGRSIGLSNDLESELYDKTNGVDVELIRREFDKAEEEFTAEFDKAKEEFLEEFNKEMEGFKDDVKKGSPKFQVAETITLNNGKKIESTVINGNTIFYHASSRKRDGRLTPNRAVQWGAAIYFSPSRKEVVAEFGDKYVTEVRLNLSNPVYTNTRNFSEVSKRALEIFTEEQRKKRGDDDISFGIDDIEDGYYFGEAAKQLGYDAIIDLDENNYGGEIAVFDEAAVIYPEDIKSISTPQKTPTDTKAPKFQTPIESQSDQNEISQKFRNLNFVLRRPNKNKIIFVSTDALLEKHAKDQPSYDITKLDNRIRGRVERAKEFIKEYINNQRIIDPKTKERLKYNVSFEPSIIDIDSNGRISFEDGRHRVLAAKELGITNVPIEVPKEKSVKIEDALSKKDSRPKFQVIGELGAEGLQTVKENLAIAKQMEADGRDAKTIFLATGWEKDARDKGQWKYDLLDGELKGELLNDRKPKEVWNIEDKLADLFESNELYSAYPELKNIKVAYSQKADNGASYSRDIKTITLNAGVYATKSQVSLNDRRSILIHEIQHAIQDIEGFARGGSKDTFKTPDSVLEDLARQLPELSREDRRFIKGVYEERGLSRIGVKPTVFDVISDDIDRIEDWVNKLDILVELYPNEKSYRNLLDALDLKLMGMGGENVAFEKYLALAGEVEARNAQRRAGMTPEQRKTTMISESELLEGVRPEDKIYLYGEGALSKKDSRPKFQTPIRSQSEQNEIEKERRAIEEKAKADGTFGKAPNGKKSNLTDEQWVTVRTKRFKDWFGDWQNDPKNASKVVDENGEPMVVYHGSPNSFDIFEERGSRGEVIEYGWSFSTNKELSKVYGDNIRPFFLNIRNMVSFDAKYETNIEAYDNLEIDLGYKIASGRPALGAISGNNTARPNARADGLEARNVIDMFLGGRQPSADEIQKYSGNTYMVWFDSPQNIKSATSNVGAFSESSPNIMFQTPIDEAFDRQRALLETMSKRGGVLTKAVVKFADRASPLKKALIDANLKNARDLFVAQAGAGSRAKMFVDENFGAIYDDLNKENSDYLDKIIQLRRIIQIDEDFDSKGKERIQHTEGESGVPINKEIAEANLNDYRNTLGITLFNDLMRRSETYFDAYKKLLDIMRENGLITQDLYDTLKPLLYQPRRFLDNFVNFKDGDTSIDIKDLALNAAQIKKLEGGSDSEIMMNSRLLLAFSAKSVFSRVARNKTYTAIAEAANDPNNSSWISTDSQRNFSPVNYFVDGEKTQFYIREDFQKQLYDATRHLIDPNIAKNIRILSGSAILKSFATQVNPLFALKNFPRDVLHVAMFTNIYGNNLYSSIFKISRDAFKGMHDKMSKSTDFKEWLEYGGGMDFLSTEGFEAQSIQGGSFNKLKNALSTFGEYSEVGVRLAVYKKTKGDLMSDFVSRNGRQPNAEEADQIKTQAAVASREIIDFAQGGSWAKAGENVIPYLNASIQGFRVGAQYIKNNPVNFAIKLAQLSLSVGIIMFYNALVADDDDWEKISDGEKMRNFIIFTPLKDKKGNRYYLKIAKTQQAMPFTTLAEIGAGKMLNQVLNQDDDKGLGSKYMMYGDKEYTAMKDAVLSFLPKNPAEWTKEIKSAIPILNAVNAIDNYDTFFNTKVSYDYEKVESRYEDILDPNTPYFYKALSQSLYPVVGIGPKRLATAVEKVTTGPETSVIIAGAYFMLDKVASKVANVKTDDLNIGEVPTQNSELKAISSMFSPLKSVLKATNPNLKKYQYEDQLNEIALKSSARIETIKSASRNLGEKYYDAVNGKGGLTKAEVIAEFNDFRDMLIKKDVPQSQVINFVNSFKMSARSNPRENWDAGYYDIMYSPTSDATVEMIGKLKGKNLTDEQLKDYMIKYRMNTGYNIKNAGEVYKLYRQQRDAK